MNYESKFGKQLLQCVATAGQMLRRRLRFLVPALVFIGAGFVTMASPDTFSAEEQRMALPLFFGVGAVAILLAIVLVKRSEAVIYENGFVFTRGSKVTELNFDNVKGISDWTTSIKFYGVISVGSVREVKIVKQDGEKIALTDATGFNLQNYSLPNFDQLADELGAVITKRLLKDVAKEKIGYVNISFGDQLEFTGGQFVYNEDKGRNKIYIPLSKVIGAEIPEDSYWLFLLGPRGQDGKAERLASIRADKALNLGALYRIIEMSK